MALGGVMTYAVRMANFDIKKYIGANIRRIRDKTGEKQEAFALLLETDQSTLSLWETGSRMPRLEELVGRLERAGLDPRDLVAPQAEGEDEYDPDIARAVAALRDLPEPVRKTIASLADSLRLTIPRDYDAESADLLRMLSRVDPQARGGILLGIRQLLQTLAPSSVVE
jgi:transcriptional regulator with XRE-family HTH domain